MCERNRRRGAKSVKDSSYNRTYHQMYFSLTVNVTLIYGVLYLVSMFTGGRDPTHHVENKNNTNP